jgi:hypothetical protein
MARKGTPIFPSEAQAMGPLDKDVPTPRTTAFVKRRIRLRAGLRLYRDSLISPLFSGRAIFGYLTSIIGLFLLFGFLDETALSTRLSQTAVAFVSVIAATAIWAVGLAVAIPFRVRKAESKNGSWNGNRFVYREPQLAQTKEWTPADNGNYPLFAFRDAYPGALIDYKIEVDGPVERLNCIVVGAYYFRPIEKMLQHVRFDLRGRVRLRKDRQLVLACHSRPDTLPAIVRVYVLAWEMDQDTLLDYTDIRTQTRFVLRPPDLHDSAVRVV